MQTQSYIPLIVAVVGLSAYLTARKPEQSELKEAGRIAFAFGLLVVLYQCAALAFFK